MEKLIDKLKPCPFCGGKPLVRIVNGRKYKAIIVECLDCRANIPIEENKLIGYWKPTKIYKTVEDKACNYFGDYILKAWNRRVSNGNLHT